MKSRMIAIVMAMVLAPLVAMAETNKLDTFKDTFQQQENTYLFQYGRALDGIMEALKQKGNIDAYLVVEAERNRFELAKTVPAANGANVIFRTAVDSYYKSIADLRFNYVKALEGLITQFMQMGKIAEAKAAKVEKDRITALMGVKPAPAPVVTASPALVIEQNTGKQSGLEIVRATYGIDNRRIDITDYVKKQVKDNSLTLLNSDYLTGDVGDPAYGVYKTIEIKYRFNGGELKTSSCIKNETIEIPKVVPVQMVLSKTKSELNRWLIGTKWSWNNPEGSIREWIRFVDKDKVECSWAGVTTYTVENGSTVFFAPRGFTSRFTFSKDFRSLRTADRDPNPRIGELLEK